MFEYDDEMKWVQCSMILDVMRAFLTISLRYIGKPCHFVGLRLHQERPEVCQTNNPFVVPWIQQGPIARISQRPQRKSNLAIYRAIQKKLFQKMYLGESSRGLSNSKYRDNCSEASELGVPRFSFTTQFTLVDHHRIYSLSGGSWFQLLPKDIWRI